MARLVNPRPSLLTRAMDRAVLPGMLGFTKLGYRLGKRRPQSEPRTLAGRRVVITGATSGLGLASAQRLAALGADLALVGRDHEKLSRVAAEIRRGSGSTVAIHRADLSLMREVRALAGELLSQPTPIHVLINNAGALFDRFERTDEGYERSLALNLMSPFLLTNLLIPRLITSAPARIINVSSGGMYTQRIRVDDLGYEKSPYDGAKAYARAKRGQMILTEIWAEELASRDVVVHAMHPGWADTPGVRTALPTFYKLTRPFLRTAEEGADTIVWLAAADEPSETTGGFWLDRKPHLKHVLPGTRASEEERRALVRALEAPP